MVQYINPGNLDKEKTYYRKHPLSGNADKLIWNKELDGWQLTRISIYDVPDTYNKLWG